jgi:8-oxo-dGTP diphosphatase
MLIQRKDPPFQEKWALPGGFLDIDENLEDGAKRELQEETGMKDVYLEQFRAFGELGRDPRGRTVTIAYLALVNLSEHHVKAASDAKDADWFPVNELPELAFDHRKIIDMALKKLKENVRLKPVGFELLPDKFTLSQLQKLYETILEKKLDKRNFRRKILKMDLLIELNERQTGTPHRPARLYQFDKEKYEKLLEGDFYFDV